MCFCPAVKVNTFQMDTLSEPVQHQKRGAYTRTSSRTVATSSNPCPPDLALFKSTARLHNPVLAASTGRHSARPLPIRLTLLFAARLSAACAWAGGALLNNADDAAWGADMVSVPCSAPLPCTPLAAAAACASCAQPEVPGAEPWPLLAREARAMLIGDVEGFGEAEREWWPDVLVSSGVCADSRTRCKECLS